jgi:hypothetical protein
MVNNVATIPGQMHGNHFNSTASQLGGAGAAGAGSSSTIHPSINGKNLFKWLMIQLEEFLYQQNFTTDWSAFSPYNVQLTAAGNMNDNASQATSQSNRTTVSNTTDTFVIEIENSPAFSKMWSALCFLFCINDYEDDSTGYNNKNSKDEGDDNASHASNNMDKPASLTNFIEFGHGFIIAGTLFLHLLGQKPLFELLDFSNQVVKLYEYEVYMNESILHSKSGGNTNGGVSGSGGGGVTAADAINAADNLIDNPAIGKVDPSLLKEYKFFVKESRKLLEMNSEWFAYYHSVYQSRSSYTKYATNKNIFHPPSAPTLSFK